MAFTIEQRMKDYYESRYRQFLPRRTYTIIRIDGKAFHTFTRGMKKPFSESLMDAMDETAIYLCENIQGAKFAYVQSDEISILLTDFDTLNTEAWFDGNIQKICSVSASMATARFNSIGLRGNELAHFDSRCFIIPSEDEMLNYFIWRQKDWERNSVHLVASYYFSHKQLHGKSNNEMQEMLFQEGVNWNNYEPKYKRGRAIIREIFEREEVQRSRWICDDAPPIFTQEREYISRFLPKL